MSYLKQTIDALWCIGHWHKNGGKVEDMLIAEEPVFDYIDNLIGRNTKPVCRNCEHWHRYPKASWDTIHHKDGRCKCPKLFHSGESYDYAHNVRLRRNPDITPINGLRFWAGDDWGGGFAVGPEFGCVHWEPRS